MSEKVVFVGHAIIAGEGFPSQSVLVHLCVFAPSQWAACKKVEQFLHKDSYYGTGEIESIILKDISTPYEQAHAAKLYIIP